MKRLKHDRYFDKLAIMETKSEWQIFSYSSHIATVSRTSMELTSLGSDYNYSSTTSKHLKDTVALYDEFDDECDEWLNEQIEQTGLRPDQLFRDWDYSINSDLNKNTVIWAMFEEYVANEV